MKMLLATAAALAFASPAIAQSADPHAGHHPAQHEGKSDGHQMECCKDKNGNGKPDCCDKAEQKGKDQHSGH